MTVLSFNSIDLVGQSTVSECGFYAWTQAIEIQGFEPLCSSFDESLYEFLRQSQRCGVDCAALCCFAGFE